MRRQIGNYFRSSVWEGLVKASGSFSSSELSLIFEAILDLVVNDLLVEGAV